ncbi:MAG: Gfo/Idh/MocA family oxidoreductase [Firmicutes bacterium]|nr:Gfo/Idh/MocA family oxidoreductase [Bacillota bacterium]
MKTIKTAIVGLGSRGYSLLKDVVLTMDDVQVIGVCDLFEDRMARAAAAVKKKNGAEPLQSADFEEILALEGLDCVMITTSWETHIPMAIQAMRAGIRPGVEVGAAYSLEQLWDLVHTYEETKVPCMLLENCCYGRYEMMIMNMISQGVFGDLVHLEGGYRHDLREEISRGRENRHYRNANYRHRNTENYPTHELGPICQMLGIGHGNRMVKLVSQSSCARGLNAYNLKDQGPNGDQVSFPFAQGDVTTTIITCAHGETITLTLDTSLPRFYSRGLVVQGTKGIYQEDNQSIWLDGQYDEMEGFYWRKHWGCADDYRQQYESPTWVNFLNDGVRGGHGGMDYLVDRAFFDSVRDQTDPPIDVYDMAAWMSIGVLAEQSILQGGAPVMIPDFTNGRWFETYRKP